MNIKTLKINNLRNINSAKLDINPKFNFIVGDNGSGKTTTLEAFYLLCTGKSFKTRESSHLISKGKGQMTVFASLEETHQVSIQKDLHSNTKIQFNGSPCKTTSEIAYQLPCLIFYQDIFNIIDAGPSIRRALLDWGMFHVKHSYLQLWQQYNKLLKHRNALLRKQANYEEFLPWDNMLVERAEQLDELRTLYFKQLKKTFTEVLKKITNVEVDIAYYKGWDRQNKGESLISIFKQSYQQDVKQKYTKYGAHHADIDISSCELGKVKKTYSRGQQKAILFALKISQGLLLEKDCLYLIDDLSSELDDSHIKNIFCLLDELKGQFVITSISELNKYVNKNIEINKFKVEKGMFSEILL